MTKPMTPTQVFGLRVRAARENLRLTQQELVDRLSELGQKMDRSTLNRLERGHPSASAALDKVFTIAAALDVSPVELITPVTGFLPVAVTPTLVVPAQLTRAWMESRAALPPRSVSWAELSESELKDLVWRERTRGMEPIAAALMADELKEEVRQTVDEILNSKKEDDGQPASTS
jgi:transcriptional regulator with XRE-family HTH domain